ncbi:superoxide dismutase [Gloeopeniophorella convolvens]|nr:superoxide dismutase [Gloeopeniophorella convolvens]
MDSHSSSSSLSVRTLVFGGVAFLALLVWLWPSSRSADGPIVYKAVAVLSGDSSVTGTVIFEQGSKDGSVTVRGDLKSLDPSASRGFHIHQLGDASNGCTSAGSHFNPYNQKHGAPTDSERHVGDLGNIQSDEDGIAKFTLTDSKISLNGPLSIVGRSVVLHAGTDDLGRGNNEESLKTGNAGARAACGVIGVSELR